MSGSLSDFFSGLGTGVGNLFDWLAAPSPAQQAMQAGRWNDPALAASDRTSGLLQGAIQGALASQKGLGPGASLAASLLPMSQAGMAESQQRANIGEALARMGLTQAQTGEINTLLPFRSAGLQAQTALTGAQTGQAQAQTNEINQLLGPRIAQLQSATGLNQAQTWALVTKTPAEIQQILSAAGLNQAQMQEAMIKIAQARSYLNLTGTPDPTANLPSPGAALSGYTSPALAQREGGGDYATGGTKTNPYIGTYQFGAPLLSDLGVYTPGKDENWPKGAGDPRTAPSNAWTGTFNIPGHPEVKTVQDFLGNGAAQEAVQQKNLQNSVASITRLGLDKYIGQTIGGVPVTLEGMTNAIHLGGVGGLTNWLQTGGNTDVADKNGTKISDYMRLGAKSTAAPAAAPTAAPTAAPAASATPAAAPAPVAAATPPQGTLPPPGATLQALLAGVQQARSDVRPPGVLAPVLTAGPGAPTGNPPAAVPAPGAMPAPGAALQPYAGLSFGGAPRTFGGAGAGAPGSAVAPAASGGAPVSAPAPQTSPIVSSTTSAQGPGAAYPPGMTQPRDVQLTGTPQFGLKTTDSIPEALTKIKAQDPSLAARLITQINSGDLSGIAMYMHPPVTIMHTGTANDPYGANPGQQIVVSYDPLKPGDPPTVKELAKGVDPEFLVNTANKLGADWRTAVEKPAFELAASQVQSAFRAYGREAAAGQGDFLSDATILHAWAKVMDPRAIVRAGTMDFLQADANPQQAVDRWLSQHSTGGRLSDRDRDLVMRNIEDAFVPRVEAHDEMLKQFQDTAVAETNSKQAADLVGKPYSGPKTYSEFDDRRLAEQKKQSGTDSSNPLADPNRNPFRGDSNTPKVTAPAAAPPAPVRPPLAPGSPYQSPLATPAPGPFGPLPTIPRWGPTLLPAPGTFLGRS